MRAGGLGIGLGYVRRPTDMTTVNVTRDRPSADSAATAAVAVGSSRGGGEYNNIIHGRIVKSAFRLVDVTFFPYLFNRFPNLTIPFRGTCASAAAALNRAYYTEYLRKLQKRSVKPRPQYLTGQWKAHCRRCQWFAGKTVCRLRTVVRQKFTFTISCIIAVIMFILYYVYPFTFENLLICKKYLYKVDVI